MSEKAIQDYYPDALSHCYGCGRLNPDGLQLKSHWDGEEAVAIVHPRPYHIAIPGYVYGGLLASIVDCHGTGTAAAAATQAAGLEVNEDNILRFVTGSLHVKYLKPTPMGIALEVRGRATEIKGRKVVVSITVTAGDEVVVTGEVVALQMPDHLFPKDEAK